MNICMSCVIDTNYVNQSLIAIKSFHECNSEIPIIAYIEKDVSIDIFDYVEVRRYERNYNDVFEYVGGDLLLVPRDAMSSISQRIKALEKLRNEYDYVINLDMDTLTVRSIAPIISKLDNSTLEYFSGVDERENRNKWVKSLGIKEPVKTENYFNTGFCIYGSQALKAISYDDYIKVLKSDASNFLCPEQDYLNLRLQLKNIKLNPTYNMMISDNRYQERIPTIIHYLGIYKPWATTRPINKHVSYYFANYANYVNNNISILDTEFVKQVNINYEFSKNLG